jgi:hypothetical protein
MTRQKSPVTVRFSWLTDTHVTDIKAYRNALKEQYQCQRVALVYEEIEKTVK